MPLSLYKKALYTLPLLVSLAACGGGSSGGGATVPPVSGESSINLTATFTKGLVNGGQCSLFSVSQAGVLSTSAIATVTTNSSGIANFTNVVISGSALIECSGGTYIDEATGETRVPPNLRAVIDTDTNIAPVISPLTEIAVRQAEQDADGLLSALTNYNSANDLGVDASVIVPTDLQSAAATDDDAGRYAILLAVISQLAENRGADTADELEDLITSFVSDTVSDIEIATAFDNLATAASTAAANIPSERLNALETALELKTNTPGVALIEGSAIEGQTLMVNLQDSNGISTSTIRYQWTADTVDIPSATASSYVLTDQEVGTIMTVTLSYVDDDGFDERVTSTATNTVTQADTTDLVGWGSDDSVPAIVCDTVVSSLSALEDAVSDNMPAGRTICLADGNYSSNLELQFSGIGTRASPITVAAQNPGSAVISGISSVRMSGEYLVLQGLVFHNGQSEHSDLIQTRTSSTEWCHYCRITEVSIVDVGDADSDSGKWINVYGHHNRIDHNWFAGKSNVGALLVINREADDANPANTEVDFAQVDHNYFGDRPPVNGKAYADGSDNDFEAIRTGTSDSHAFDSFSVFENNYFERIDAEAEVISNKAGNNRIINNTVRDSFGSITLRHGASAEVAHNFMIGDGHPFAAGIRIIDDSHRVVNNYIEGARYLNTRFHGAIVIHNGDASTSNGYQNVENVLVAHNTIVDSVNSLNFHGGRESISPTDIYFVNNIIDNGVEHLINEPQSGLPANSTYAGNYYEADTFSDNGSLNSAAGFIALDAQLLRASDGLFRPDTANGPDLSAAMVNIGNFDAVDIDMDGQTRSSLTISGADEVSSQTTSFGILTRDDVGPINYQPPESVGFVIRYPLVNYGFDNGGDGWVLTSGAAITNTVGEVFARDVSVKLNGVGRVAQTVNIEANTNYTLSAFVKGTIDLGVSLGGQESSSTSNNSSYRFERHSFNSGANTSVTLFADLPGELSQSVTIGNADFTGFAGVSDNNWLVTEGEGIGKVQDSGNSASGDDGSVKFRWEDTSTGGQPGITQLLTNIEPMTDFSLSAYVLDKNDTGATVTMGVYEGNSTNVLASKELDYAALDSANAPEGDDSFLQDSFDFNSGANTSLTLFVIYNANNSGGAELRVDDIDMTFEGAPTSDAQAFVDEFRLVSHPEL